MTRLALVSSVATVAAASLAMFARSESIECFVITPGATLDNGSFVLLAAPTVGTMQHADFGALVGPLGCFNDEMPPAIFGDLDGDGCVNGGDLGILLGSWNDTGVADLSNDGIVNGADMGLLLGSWGNGC